MRLKRKQEGFTIIEVVLVLAIAGLIFLIVFLALPQLQRSRRDTQRKSDAGRIVAALESYAGNNNGNYPAESSADAAGNFGDYGDDNSFWGQYIDPSEMVDPSEGNYTISFGGSGGNDPGEVDYNLGVDCDGNSGSRVFAVTIGLEQGNYCQDNR